MRCVVLYSSKGGNTRMVADALADALSTDADKVTPVEVASGHEGDAVSAVAEADAVLAGFWTDKGDCAPEMAQVLSQLEGKRVFLFGTAGFGGEATYFERIVANVKTHLPESAVLIGSAMCQGKMGMAVRRRYEAALAEHPGDARMQAMIDNFDAALSHPSAEDLAGIVDAAKDALGL